MLSRPLSVAVTLLVAAGCNNPDVVVINHGGASVPAARDLQACEVLAADQFEPSSDQIRAAYEKAVRQGRVVRLPNGLDMQQQELLNYQDGRLIPWTHRAR